MSPLRFIRHFLLIAISLVVPYSVHAQATQGVPWYTIPLPVPNGFVDAMTGNVHLEIPIGSVDQRNGDPQVVKFIYDTTRYVYGSSGFTGGNGGWHAFIGTSHYGTASFQSSSQDCTSAGFSGYPFGNVTTYFGFTFQDSHGTWHPVVNSNIYTKQVNCSTNQGIQFGSSSDITSAFGAAADGSGYGFSVSNYTQMIVGLICPLAPRTGSYDAKLS